MKDYTLNRVDRKQFITGYDICMETNELIIHKADATIEKVTYTRENEQNIQKKMEKQVKKGIRNYDKLYRRYQYYFSITMGVLLGIGCSFLFNLFTMQQFITDPILYVGLGSLPVTIYKWHTYKKTVDELNKMTFFLIHKAELNDNVRKHQMLTEGMRKESVKQIKESNPWKPVFDFNNLDHYSLNELKILRENIKTKQRFDQIPQQTEQSQSAKILTFPTKSSSSEKENE